MSITAPPRARRARPRSARATNPPGPRPPTANERTPRLSAIRRSLRTSASRLASAPSDPARRSPAEDSAPSARPGFRRRAIAGCRRPGLAPRLPRPERRRVRRPERQLARLADVEVSGCAAALLALWPKCLSLRRVGLRAALVVAGCQVLDLVTHRFIRGDRFRAEPALRSPPVVRVRRVPRLEDRRLGRRCRRRRGHTASIRGRRGWPSGLDRAAFDVDPQRDRRRRRRQGNGPAQHERAAASLPRTAPARCAPSPRAAAGTVRSPPRALRRRPLRAGQRAVHEGGEALRVEMLGLIHGLFTQNDPTPESC